MPSTSSISAAAGGGRPRARARGGGWAGGGRGGRREGGPSLEAKVRGGGLRGGSFRGTKRGLVLDRYQFVKGFPVSGLVRPRGKVTLTVPHGRLTFRGGSLQRRTIAAQLGAQRP